MKKCIFSDQFFHIEFCSYNCRYGKMLFEWDEAKRLDNLRRHGIDFRDMPEVFDGVTRTYEDDRFYYGERRFITIGLLHTTVILVTHTETDETIRIIHARKADKATARRFFESLPD